MKKLVMILLILGMLFTAHAETGIVSDGVILSEFPQDLFLDSVLRVDIIGEPKGVITHPPDLYQIALTDGTHVAWAYWEPDGENVWFCFFESDIQRMDGTMGLWLIFLRR